MDLDDHGLVGVPDAHELLGGSGETISGPGEVLPRVPLAIGGDVVVPVVEAAPEVVAAAERSSSPPHDDHLDRIVLGRQAYRLLELVGHRWNDRVQLLRSVERHRCDRAVHAVEHRLKVRHASFTESEMVS